MPPVADEETRNGQLSSAPGHLPPRLPCPLSLSSQEPRTVNRAGNVTLLSR